MQGYAPRFLGAVRKSPLWQEIGSHAQYLIFLEAYAAIIYLVAGAYSILFYKCYSGR